MTLILAVDLATKEHSAASRNQNEDAGWKGRNVGQGNTEKKHLPQKETKETKMKSPSLPVPFC
jgi:hypothetical protein